MNATQGEPDNLARAQTPPESSVTTPGTESQYTQPHRVSLSQGQIEVRNPDAKSPALACCLSAMPGLGQIYVGYYQRGFVHAVVVGVLIAIQAGGQLPGLMVLIGFLLPFFWLYNMIDAYRRAALYNYALSGRTTIEPPKDFQMPKARGSIFGGLVVIAFSVILLSHTRFGVPLEWLEEWWPVAPLVLGAYLLIKGIQERGGAGRTEAKSVDGARE